MLVSSCSHKMFDIFNPLSDIFYTFFDLYNKIELELQWLCCLINDKVLVYIFLIQQIPGSKRWKRWNT